MSDDIPRETVSLPERIDFPRLLDFYEMQDAANNQLHEFYDHLADGQLTTTQCADCGAIHFPPRNVCPECMGDDLSYVPLPHEGTLYAFSEVRGSAPIGMNEDVPFVVGVVDLDGGDVRLSARIDGVRYDDLSIGDPVELKIIDIDGPTEHDRVFYRFVPTGER